MLIGLVKEAVTSKDWDVKQKDIETIFRPSSCTVPVIKATAMWYLGGFSSRQYQLVRNIAIENGAPNLFPIRNQIDTYKDTLHPEVKYERNLTAFVDTKSLICDTLSDIVTAFDLELDIDNINEDDVLTFKWKSRLNNFHVISMC